MNSVSFSKITSADLVVDAIYEGGSAGNTSDDPISKLLPGCGNQGGFRAAGKKDNKKFVVLYTSGEDRDWPDSLDIHTGQFIYYGDNKTPGDELHSKSGNLILRRVFDLLHRTPHDFSTIPPFFIFQKYSTEASSRSVQFKGLAVPGFPALPATADLVAVWKTKEGQRFQNYRAILTVLDVPAVKRSWLDELAKEAPDHEFAPSAWRDWIDSGRYLPLTAEPTTIIRTNDQQTPDTAAKAAILNVVWEHFKEHPHGFEMFAARIYQMHDPRVIIDEITRTSVDGGRDAIGRYLMGLVEDPVYAEFALEAKCYRPSTSGDAANSVGVSEVARLISRIRHREFGVLVTTSIVGRQAYKEVREDRHPIVMIAGGDISNILMKSGFNTPELVRDLVAREFPLGR